MRQEDAKREINRLFKYVYLPEIAEEGFMDNPAAPLIFYAWLSKSNPELIRFRCSGDPYQFVKIWIGFR